MANGWTAERRAKQAQLIKKWKPWTLSTGPTTAEGKRKSAKNACKNSLCYAMKDLQKILKEQANVVKIIAIK